MRLAHARGPVRIAAVIVVAVQLAWAQKARPLRVEFKPGATSAVVKNRLRGRQQMEYEVAGRTGQKIALLLAGSPPGTLALKLYDPHGAEIQLLDSRGEGRIAMLTQDGDYGISVLRVAAKPGLSTFKLTVTVR